jgi:hypothetical protein
MKIMGYVLSGLCLILLLSVVGCGPSKSRKTGKIVRGGEPIQLSDKGVFIISFYAEDDTKGANPIAASPKKDGTFEVVGTDGKGIAPGKYLVAVQAMDPYDQQKDLLGGKYAPGQTNKIVEVGAGEIIVDVGK